MSGQYWVRLLPSFSPVMRRAAAEGSKQIGLRSFSSEAKVSEGGKSYWQQVSGWKGPLVAGVVAGGIGCCGDIIAQYINSKEGEFDFDPVRTMRMGGFNGCVQGPFAYYWYNFLDWSMPRKTVYTFLTKLTGNQVILGPITLSLLFVWQYAFKGQLDLVPAKIYADLVPTIMAGWFFWIPAASINFLVVPLKFQVLYMSLCGVAWTSHISKVSVAPPTSPKEPERQPAAVTVAGAMT